MVVGSLMKLCDKLLPFFKLLLRPQKLEKLVVLGLQLNPITKNGESFRLFSIYHLRNLKYLDGVFIVGGRRWEWKGGKKGKRKVCRNRKKMV